MAAQTQSMTVEEFDRFAALPQNADRQLEYIGGEIVEMVLNQRSASIAYWLGVHIGMYLLQHNLGGVATGADGGYIIAGERYMPDIAYTSPSRQAEPSDEAWSAVPPDLVVEVLSPSNTAHETRFKVVNYLLVGSVVWVVDPERDVVEVYVPGQPVKTVDRDGVLDGGEVLPDFSVAVRDVLRE